MPSITDPVLPKTKRHGLEGRSCLQTCSNGSENRSDLSPKLGDSLHGVQKDQSFDSILNILYKSKVDFEKLFSTFKISAKAKRSLIF